MVSCPNCGKLFRHVLELSDVRQVGLALKGTCPGCGARIGVNKLWRKTAQVYQVGTCPICGKMPERVGKSKRPKYCSVRCKQVAYRRHKQLENG